jgi:hypothetical protein
MVSGMAQSCSITSTGSGSFVFGQRIESANTRDLAGKTITVSCKVYHDTGSSLSVSMYLYKANVADNFTATTQVDTTKSVGNAASGAFTSVSSTFTVGSSDASNGLQIEVAFTSVGALTSKNFAIGDWQLEVGSVATPFEQRPYGLELALCQRYYYRITPGAINSLFNGVGGSTSSTASALMFQYPVQMRTTPAALEQSGTAADYAVFNLGSSSAINCSSVPTFAASTNTYGAQVSFSVASGLTAGQAIIGRTGSVSGANAYLGWSAEL